MQCPLHVGPREEVDWVKLTRSRLSVIMNGCYLWQSVCHYIEREQSSWVYVRGCLPVAIANTHTHTHSLTLPHSLSQSVSVTVVCVYSMCSVSVCVTSVRRERVKTTFMLEILRESAWWRSGISGWSLGGRSMLGCDRWLIRVFSLYSLLLSSTIDVLQLVGNCFSCFTHDARAIIDVSILTTLQWFEDVMSSNSSEGSKL
jgi:hypothetical protein